MLGDDDGAAERLWGMAQLATPMAVRTAATLRIADHLSDGPLTAVELAERTEADADTLDRLLRYLTGRGLLSRDDTGRYTLTALGAPLRDDHPSALRGWLDADGAGRAELAFVQLPYSVRTGEAAYPVQFGISLWKDLTVDRARGNSFNQTMGATAPDRAPAVAEALDWGALRHVVDVGGGNGTLLTHLLTHHPALRGTVVDRPETTDAARKALAAAGLADRADVVAGSFFRPLPPGAGGYLLSLVLHNWDDAAATGILRRCAAAGGRDGSVFVIERLRPDGSPHTGMDLRMLVYCGGRERGTTELKRLGAAAGLHTEAVHRAGPWTIVHFRVA